MRRSGGQIRDHRSMRLKLLVWASLAGALFVTAVGAQSEPGTYAGGVLQERDEVLIGTIDVDSTSESQADTPSSFYAKALKALEENDVGAAQRLFEQAVAADPDGRHATLARHHLGQLYSTAGGNAEPAGTEQGDTPGDPEQTTEQSVAPVPDSAAGTEESPEQETGSAGIGGGIRGEPSLQSAESRRAASASADQQFLMDAGDRVFFGHGSADLGTRARAVLSAQAKWLVKRPNWNVIIEGHADDPPLAANEMEELSEARAEAVRQRLVSGGVAAGRVSIVPWGRQVPVSDCSEAACQAQNRRAVSVLTPQRPSGQSGLGNQGDRFGQTSPLTASRSGLAGPGSTAQ